ncbi:hypothetical protein NECID01_1211 [Nematocida sp. AWRm77]|nr:hypothetical protein NECID01_1211 [Nematocida sp. AWRm77]
MECWYFQQGVCRYGDKCRRKHVKRTSLLDPPGWILSAYRDKDISISENTYSFEETRYGFYLARAQGIESLRYFFGVWNEMVVSAYNRLVCALNAATAGASEATGPDGRTVDIRRPECFSFLIQPVNTNTLDYSHIIAGTSAPAPIPTPIPIPTPASVHCPLPPNSSPSQGPAEEFLKKEIPISEQEQREATEYKLGQIPRHPPRY